MHGCSFVALAAQSGSELKLIILEARDGRGFVLMIGRVQVANGFFEVPFRLRYSVLAAADSKENPQTPTTRRST